MAAGAEHPSSSGRSRAKRGSVMGALDRISGLLGHLTDQILSYLPLKHYVVRRASLLSSEFRYAGTTSDRISDLPRHLTDQILSCLPLKDAVRTSVLSSKRRYTWTTIPGLVFDDSCSAQSPSGTLSSTYRLVDIVDRVLSSHTGTIEKFGVLCETLIDISDVDRWLLHLWRASTKELRLRFVNLQGYEMPSSLFLCHDLVNLDLAFCSLKPPPAFKGFKNMTILKLYVVKMSRYEIESLIKGSPLLQTLMLAPNARDIFCLSIDAPNLRHLELFGCGLEAVSFGGHRLTSLMVASFTLRWCGENQDANRSYLLEFFDQLPQIERLSINSWFLRYLSFGKVPEILPDPCIRLQCISINMDIRSLAEITTVLCILKGSPNLKELHLSGKEFDFSEDRELNGNFWDDYSSPCSFENLKVVSLISLPHTRQIMGFIWFLLSHSPALERMEVWSYPSHGTESCELLLQECVQFPRASARADVVFMGCLKAAPRQLPVWD
ncbi:F-box/FBD/LRR-repeat protein At1g13570-like isoform X2 [Punica granatum]|uniref:F-box/FBD/LRR-repeat protein At1g13570-like isoform X2 n=2 Tax=Punica granatum TaxID=22663 RepID=A0A6P8EDP8_PUNGR|nr:F-box/FBD/LRR-repeat protein At1g13570-like isoform X2 [Punica granatum]PKI43765.1 hypothetical protein CRG98_035871 [Punica granatum]